MGARAVTLIRTYIEKFGREVLIDEDHPLAVAQRAQAQQKSAAAVPKPSPRKREPSGGQH